jgi:hypothetical protein
MFVYFLSNLGMGAGGVVDPILCSLPFDAYTLASANPADPCGCKS